MSLNESIDSLVNATVTIKRHAEGTWVSGVYVKGALTTITGVDGVLQPAFNLNRVIGGSDIDARVDNQSTETVLSFRTRTRLNSRTPTRDPDIVSISGVDGFDDGEYTVARVESWGLETEIHYHAVITKQTGGSS